MASQKVHLHSSSSGFVTAAYLYLRLIPQLSQALHLELFALPSLQREFARASKLKYQ
jgi:hypothetical protein